VDDHVHTDEIDAGAEGWLWLLRSVSLGGRLSSTGLLTGILRRAGLRWRTSLRGRPDRHGLYHGERNSEEHGDWCSAHTCDAPPFPG
jgi:hypothetical protein